MYFIIPLLIICHFWCFQVNGVLELDETPEGTARYSALDKWTTQLTQLQKIIVNRMTWKWQEMLKQKVGTKHDRLDIERAFMYKTMESSQRHENILHSSEYMINKANCHKPTENSADCTSLQPLLIWSR